MIFTTVIFNHMWCVMTAQCSTRSKLMICQLLRWFLPSLWQKHRFGWMWSLRMPEDPEGLLQWGRCTVHQTKCISITVSDISILCALFCVCFQIYGNQRYGNVYYYFWVAVLRGVLMQDAIWVCEHRGTGEVSLISAVLRRTEVTVFIVKWLC